MKVTGTTLNDVFVITPILYQDERGVFLRHSMKMCGAIMGYLPNLFKIISPSQLKGYCVGYIFKLGHTPKGS